MILPLFEVEYGKPFKYAKIDRWPIISLVQNNKCDDKLSEKIENAINFAENIDDNTIIAIFKIFFAFKEI
jgi:hypothetical protein